MTTVMSALFFTINAYLGATILIGYLEACSYKYSFLQSPYMRKYVYI